MELNDKLDPQPMPSIEAESIILLNDTAALKKRSKQKTRDKEPAADDKDKKSKRGKKKKDKDGKAPTDSAGEEQTDEKPKPSAFSLLKEVYL